jgi:signal peptidase I
MRKRIIFIFLILVTAFVLILILSGKIKEEKKKITNKPAEKLKKEEVRNEKSQNCPIKIEEKIVRGNSLEPLIKDGETIEVLFGYYDCHPIQRNDIVVYFYAGNKNPIIKIIKGIPGDKFSLKKTNNGWYILINGEILKNSENQPYILDERGYRVLSLYEKDYKGIIPEDAYLILGNLPQGSLDSSHFGLVGKKDILGKVRIK